MTGGANSNGTLCLLRVQLIECHDKYCEIGQELDSLAEQTGIIC